MNKRYLSKKILFCGYYGMDNLGDDSFCVISTWGARCYWNSEKIFILSNKKLKGPVEIFPAIKSNKKFYKLALFESLLQTMHSSCVIWSGGSIFNAKIKICSQKYFSLIASKIGITPAGAIGVSLGPYASIADEKSVHEYLRHLQFLTLRDRPSYEEALSINLPFKPVLAADLALLLPKVVEYHAAVNLSKNILGVTLCHYERYTNKDIRNENRREATLLNALIELRNKGYNGLFRFFVFNGNKIYGDMQITNEFSDKLKHIGANVELIPYSNDAISIWNKVSECTAMLSTRLHGAIFAAAADVPCCLVEYHRKCGDFLVDIGVCEEWRIGDAGHSGSTIADKLIKLLSYGKQPFYHNRDQLIALSEKNFTFS